MISKTHVRKAIAKLNNRKVKREIPFSAEPEQQNNIKPPWPLVKSSILEAVDKLATSLGDRSKVTLTQVYNSVLFPRDEVDAALKTSRRYRHLLNT